VDALARIAAEPAAAALFLDIDGVLAPIVERREDARVPPETRRELRRLGERYALVACVTGRPTEVARAIVGVDGLTYVGEHGLELAPEAKQWAEPIHGFAVEVPWVDVEVKPLSVAFHYRTAPDPDLAREELEGVAAAALDLGFRARWGRMVLEVLPPVAASKGTAVRHLLETTGLRRALYAGDDTTDLDGFAALDGLEAAVRVAVVSPEGPTELGERADVIVGSPEVFREVLRQL
jgi:trehalose 6-phosphate phosphatase